MRSFFLSAALVLAASTLQAQAPVCTGQGRYTTPIFDCVDTLNDRVYGSGLKNWTWNTNLLCLDVQLPPYVAKLPLRFDLYQPCGDTLAQRPLLILIHGGAWASGHRKDFEATARYFAQRGYVVASISYRLSIPDNVLCFNSEADSLRITRAYFRSVQDAKCAVRYFRTHADQYRIHPDYIFVGGGSAGGFAALGVAYMDQPSERPAACAAQPQLGLWLGLPLFSDLGGVEGDGGHAGVSSHVRAAINLVGGVFNPHLFDGPQKPALLCIHGTADDVVPYQQGYLLQNLLATPIYSQYIWAYGSSGLLPYALQYGVQAALLTLPQGGHGLTAAEIELATAAMRDFLCQQMPPIVSTAEPLSAASHDASLRVGPNPACEQLRLSVAIPGRFRLFALGGALLGEWQTAPGDHTLSLPSGYSGLCVWTWESAEGLQRGKLQILGR